jgi:hypothetical protein
MVILRCLAALAGLLILMFAPEFSLEAAALVYGDLGRPSWTVIAVTMAMIGLLSSGFFLVAIAGRRIIRTAWLRMLAAVLLALPMAASILALLFTQGVYIVTLAFPMLGCAVLLFIAFVWPAAGRAARRPMRPNHDSSFDPPAPLSASRNSQPLA